MVVGVGVAAYVALKKPHLHDHGPFQDATGAGLLSAQMLSLLLLSCVAPSKRSDLSAPQGPHRLWGNNHSGFLLSCEDGICKAPGTQ